MNNSDVNLIKLIDIVRQDSGVNNATEMMEQLSLLIILKYFHHAICTDTQNQEYLGSFKDLVLDCNIINNEKNKSDFSKINTLPIDLAFNVKNHLAEFYRAGLPHEIFVRFKALLEAIPFKIQSIKILDRLLSWLDTIEFDESLAEAYDGLVMKMIDDSVASGAFHSPKALVSAIVKAVNPSSSQSIYDPALGTGRFIIEAKKLIAKTGNDESNSQLYFFGRDIAPTACLIGTLNLLLNGIDIRNIFMSDSLLDNNDLTYDIILSGIPFGKTVNIDRYEHSYFGYASSLEAMFLKLTMEKLAEGGKAALIVPDGLLFNKTNELISLRSQLLTQFNLYSILSLPAGAIAPYSGVKVSVLFFEKTKAQNNIWFYKLNPSKPFGKSNQISDFDLAEFSELFPKRSETKNSCLINKNEVLSREFFDLSFNVSAENDKQRKLNIPEELSSLKEKKGEIDALWLNLTESLEQEYEVAFSKKTSLGNLVTLNAGKILAKTHIKDKGEYPVYGGNGVIGYYDQCNRTGENVIIGRVGANCGNVHIVNSPIWLTDNSFTVHVHDSIEVYLPYLAHTLRSMDLKNLARGSAQPSISNSTIKDIEISLPSYEKQIELSKWFDEIQMKNSELQKLIQLQLDKFNVVTSLSIANNCLTH